MNVGDVFSWERTFTHEDVGKFAEVSGDRGVHHVQAGVTGRLLVHGLLTATLPTKIGGDLNFLAQEMVFHFLRPVYTGDTIRCEVRITAMEERPGHTWASAEWSCTNASGSEVLNGRARGIILDRKPGRP